MADKSIWKKTLGFFVEFEDTDVKPVQDPANMDAVMAETRKSMKAMDAPPASPPPKTPAPAALSSVVSNYIPKEAVKEALAGQQGTDAAPDFEPLYLSVCNSVISVFKVEEILNQPELSNLPKETRAKAAAVALRAMGSSVEEVIQDAYLKDQALDQAELMQRQQMQDQKQNNESRIAAIQQEVDTFLKAKNTEIEALREANYRTDQELHRWIEAKLAEEKRIFQILSHFVSDDAANITLGENPLGGGITTAGR